MNVSSDDEKLLFLILLISIKPNKIEGLKWGQGCNILFGSKYQILHGFKS